MNIYVDANWDGASAAPEGYDAIFANLTDAVNAASATEATTITVAAGTYGDNIVFFDTGDKIAEEKDAGGNIVSSADVVSICQKDTTAVVNGKKQITIKAADGVERDDVKLTGSFVFGHTPRKSSASNRGCSSEIKFEDVTFDSADDNLHSIYISGSVEISMDGCAVIGAGNGMGIGTLTNNGASSSGISNCYFENSSCQLQGGLVDGMEFSSCEFVDSKVNVQGGNPGGCIISDSKFSSTISDPDEFYVIRNQKGVNISVQNSVFDVAVADGVEKSDTGEWAVFIQRGGSAGKEVWDISECEVNLEGDAADTVDLNINKGADTLVIDGLTSSSNDVAELLSKTQGDLIVKQGDAEITYKDGAMSMPAFDGVDNLVICNLDDLKKFRDMVNAGETFKGKTITLAADIDLNNEEWTPIGTQSNKFLGNFDGAGHTVKNLVVDGDIYWGSGFFGNVTNGNPEIAHNVIKNLTIENASISGTHSVGAVAGSAYCTDISNVAVIGNVNINGSWYVGAAFGRFEYGNLDGCVIDVTSGTVYSKDSNYIGGAIGFTAEGPLKYSNISSNINVETEGDCDFVGGVFGLLHYNNSVDGVECNADSIVCENATTGAIAGTWGNEVGTTVVVKNATVGEDTKVVVKGEEVQTSLMGVPRFEETDTSGSLAVVDTNEAGEITKIVEVSGSKGMDVALSSGTSKICVYIKEKNGEFSTFADLDSAVAAAENEATIIVSGDVSGKAVFDDGKNLTITGTADFAWGDGYFFVGRGSNDAVDTTVTFKDAVIGSSTNSSAYGFNIAQNEGAGSGKADGTVNIDNSSIVTDYMQNRNIVNVKGDGIADGFYGKDGEANLFVKNYFAVSRDNNDTKSAEMNLIDGAYVKIDNENGAGIGYGDGRGVLNITDSKFEAMNNLTVANSNAAVNVTDGILEVGKTFTNNGTVNVSGKSTLNLGTITGDGVIDIAAGTTLVDTVITAGNINRNSGTVYFEGANKLTGNFSNNPADWDIVINKGASLEINRTGYVLGYNRDITVYGLIKDATSLTAEDLANTIVSLKSNSTSEFSVGGTGTNVVTVNDAYVDLANTSWKNSSAQHTWTFTNSYVKAESFGNCNAGATETAAWNVTLDDSVLAASNYIKTGKGVTYNFTNGTVATTGSMRIEGALNITSGSKVYVTAYQNNKNDAADEHGDITGKVVDNATLDIKSNAKTEVELFSGAELTVKNNGTLNLNEHTLDVKEGAVVNVEGGIVDIANVANSGTFNVSGASELNGTFEGKSVKFADGTVLTSSNGVTFKNRVNASNNMTFGAGYVTADGMELLNDSVVFDKDANVTVGGTFATYNASNVKINSGAEVAASSIYINGGNVEIDGKLATLASGGDGGFIMNGKDTVTINKGGVLDVVYTDAYYTTGNMTANVYGTAKVSFKLSDGSSKFTWNIYDGGSLTAEKYGIVLNNAESAINVYGDVTAAQISNAGKITVDGGNLNVAGTFTNNGTVTVSGESTLNIDSVSGNRINLANGTSLIDSTVGGDIEMKGDLTLVDGDADTDGNGLTLSGGLWASNGGNLAGDTLTAYYAMFQSGTYTISADLELDYGYLSYGGTFTVSSKIHTVGTSGEVLYVRGSVDLVDGGVLDADNGLFLDNANAVLNVQTGAKIETSHLNIKNATAQVNLQGGNVEADKVTNSGSLTMTGTSSMTAGGLTNSGSMTVGKDSVYNHNGNFWLNAGELLVQGYVNSAWTGNTRLSAGQYDTTLTVDGTYAAADNNNGKFINTNNIALSMNAKGNLNVINGGLFSINGKLNNSQGSITVSDSTLSANYIYTNGTMTIEGNSSITAVDGFVNQGTININVADDWSGVATVIDSKEGTSKSDFGTVKIHESDEGRVFWDVNASGDLVVYTKDFATTVTFNSAWTDYSIGQEIGEGSGLYFGINAFNKFDTSGVDTSKGWSNLMVLPENTTEIVLVAGNGDDNSYGMLRPTQTITVKTEGEGYAVIDRFVNVIGNLTFAEGSMVKVLGQNGNSGANNQGTETGEQSYITINGTVYFANATAPDNSKALYCWGLSSTPGYILVNSTGKLITEAGNVESRGTIEVKGYMELGSAKDAPKLNGVGGTDIANGHLIVDGIDGAGKLVVKHHQLNFGGGDRGGNNPEYGQDWWDAAEGSTVTIKNGGVIETAAVTFRNGKNNTLTLDNGSLIFNDGSDYGVDHSNITSKYFDNMGVISASNNSTIDLADRTFANSGSMTLDSSTLTAGTFTNNGNVSLKGDVEVATITNNGNVTILGNTSIDDNGGVEIDGGNVTIGKVNEDGSIENGTLIVEDGQTVDINAFILGADEEIAGDAAINVNQGGTFNAVGLGFAKLDVAGNANFTGTVYAHDGGTVGATGKLYTEGGLYVYSDYTVNGKLELVANEAMGDYFQVGNGEKGSLTVSGKDASVELKDGNYAINGKVMENAVLNINDKASFNMTGADLINNGTVSVAGGVFNADVTNNGTFKISGMTSINATVTGNAVQAEKGAEITGTLTADLNLNGDISVVGSGMLNGAITGNKNITLKTGSGATDKTGVNMSNTDSDVNNITVSGTVVLMGVKDNVKSITVDGAASYTMFSIMGYVDPAWSLGSVEIKGKNNAEFTTFGNYLDGNKISNVKLSLSNVDLASGINASIDTISNLKSVNGQDVYVFDSKYYITDTKGTDDVADDVIYQLNSSDKITFTEVVDNEYVVGSTVIDDIPVNGNLIAKSGTVTLKVSNDKTVDIGNISKSEDGGVNNVTIGKNSEANINEINALGKLTTNVGSSIDIGTASGTNLNTTISLAKDMEKAEFDNIDLKGGNNTFSIGAKTDAVVTNDITNVKTIKLANGVAANAKKGTAEDLTSLNVNGDIAAPAMANSITLGSYAELNVVGGLVNSDVNVGTTIKAGKDAKVTFGGELNYVASLNMGANSKFETNGKTVYATAGNNTFTFGADAEAAMGTVDMKAGKNTFNVGARTDVDVTGDMLKVSTLKLANGTAANAKKGTAADLTSLNVNGNFEGVNANVNVGKNAELTIVGNMTGINKVTVGKDSEFSAASISATEKNDTFTFNSDAKVAGAVDFSFGSDTLKLGADVRLTTGSMNFGADTNGKDKDKITFAKNAELVVNGNIEGLESVTGNDSNTIYLMNGAQIIGDVKGLDKINVVEVFNDNLASGFEDLNNLNAADIFALNAGQTLSIDSVSGGSIKISTWDDAQNDWTLLTSTTIPTGAISGIVKVELGELKEDKVEYGITIA